MQGALCIVLLEEEQGSVEMNWGSEAVGSSSERAVPSF